MAVQQVTRFCSLCLFIPSSAVLYVHVIIFPFYNISEMQCTNNYIMVAVQVNVLRMGCIIQNGSASECVAYGGHYTE